MKFDELKRRVAACDYSANPQVTLHDDSATWDFNLIQFSVLVVLTCEQEDAPRTAAFDSESRTRLRRANSWKKIPRRSRRSGFLINGEKT